MSNNSKRCSLRIIASSDANQDYWILGSLFMNNYYTVFDMTPHDYYGLNFIQIGIGQTNIVYTSPTFVSYISIELYGVLLVGLVIILLVSLNLCIVLVRHNIFLTQKRQLIDIVEKIDDDTFIQDLIMSRVKQQ